MSVPKWKQAPNDNNLFLSAMEFAKHIIEISANPNIFKPEYDRVLKNRLVANAVNIYSFLWKANNTNRETNLERRKQLQDMAFESMLEFKMLWMLSKRVYHFTTKKDEYVIGWLNDLHEQAKKWQNDDIKRVKTE